MSKMVIAWLSLAAVASWGLSACSTIDASRYGRPVALESETIRYETGPCFGTCQVYAVTIGSDGKGTFEGKRFTAVTGIKTFQATPAAYRVFTAKLAPYRPTGGETLCKRGVKAAR